MGVKPLKIRPFVPVINALLAVNELLPRFNVPFKLVLPLTVKEALNTADPLMIGL